MNPAKIILIVLVIALISSFFIFDLDSYLSLEYMKGAKADIDTFYNAKPFFTAGIFFLTYVIVTGLSLPGAGIMSLIGGAIFNVLWRTIIVSFASVFGATIAFLFSRYVFRDLIQKKFARPLAPINAGIEREGGFYLFTIRLIPVFPFFIVNLLMGLTHIKTFTFAWVSQLGMIPATIVLVNAGTQLSQIQTVEDIFTFKLLGSLALLGVVPLVAKKSVNLYRKRHHLATVLEQD